MATFNWIAETTSKYFGTDFPSATRHRGLHVIRRTVNLATAVAALKSSQDFVATETIQLMDIPINTVVLAIFVRITTASDADDVDFGVDGSAATQTGFIDSVDMTSTTHTILGNTSLLAEAYSVAIGGGKRYTSADTLDMYFSGSCADTDVGIFELTMVCVDVS